MSTWPCLGCNVVVCMSTWPCLGCNVVVCMSTWPCLGCNVVVHEHMVAERLANRTSMQQQQYLFILFVRLCKRIGSAINVFVSPNGANMLLTLSFASNVVVSFAKSKNIKRLLAYKPLTLNKLFTLERRSSICHKRFRFPERCKYASNAFLCFKRCRFIRKKQKHRMAVRV